MADVGKGLWGPETPLIFSKRHFFNDSLLSSLETAQLEEYDNPYSAEYVLFFCWTIIRRFWIFKSPICKTTVYKSQVQSRKVFSLMCMINPQVSPDYPVCKRFLIYGKSSHEVIIFFLFFFLKPIKKKPITSRF